MKKLKLFILLIALTSMSALAKNSYTVQNNALILPENIQFAIHAYDVKNDKDPMLDFVAQYLKDRPFITKFRIEGHVYTERTQDENIKLSLQRAAMISYYLTTKGVDCSRLVAVAFGDSKPVAPVDECNTNINTRIDFFNAEVNHKAVFGNAVDGFAPKVYEPCEN
jgi:OOP family OmpA-OmpF porin